MRTRRFSFLAGWVAVILLALAGFAAFGTTQDASEAIDFEAASASLGHTTGTYAGLTFALFADEIATTATSTGDASESESTTDAAADEASDESSDTSRGTIASPSGWLSEVQVRALVTKYFQADDVNTAVRVAWCESRFDPSSVNLRTGAVGLFQHLPQYWDERAASAGFPGADPTDPEASTAAAAWAVYDGGGWDIFGCRG